MAQAVRRKASPALLAQLADLIDGNAIAGFIADLGRARDQRLCGSVSLKAELSFGTATDAWNIAELRPRREVA